MSSILLTVVRYCGRLRDTLARVTRLLLMYKMVRRAGSVKNFIRLHFLFRMKLMERCGMELKTEKIFYATASARKKKTRVAGTRLLFY
jgi:hypothetical protein